MHCHLVLYLNAEEALSTVDKHHKYNGERTECFF